MKREKLSSWIQQLVNILPHETGCIILSRGRASWHGVGGEWKSPSFLSPLTGLSLHPKTQRCQDTLLIVWGTEILLLCAWSCEWILSTSNSDLWLMIQILNFQGPIVWPSSFMLSCFLTTSLCVHTFGRRSEEGRWSINSSTFPNFIPSPAASLIPDQLKKGMDLGKASANIPWYTSSRHDQPILVTHVTPLQLLKSTFHHVLQK